MAKRIIHLVCKVGEKINADPETKDLLRLYFLPDYNVSVAELIIPASELSQHISTAGTEVRACAARGVVVCVGWGVLGCGCCVLRAVRVSFLGLRCVCFAAPGALPHEQTTTHSTNPPNNKP